VWYAGGYVNLDRYCHIGHYFYNRHVGELPELSPYEVDYITGASIFCPTNIFEINGLFPEHYFLYFEETDWCCEAKRKGIRLKVNPKSRLLHKKRSEDPKGLPTNYYFYYFIRAAILFRKKFSHVPLSDSVDEVRQSFMDPWIARIRK